MYIRFMGKRETLCLNLDFIPKMSHYVYVTDLKKKNSKFRTSLVPSIWGKRYKTCTLYLELAEVVSQLNPIMNFQSESLSNHGVSFELQPVKRLG